MGRSGRGQCRVGAAYLRAGSILAKFFITISHCAWRHFISLSNTTATKKRSKENAFPQSILSVPSVQTTAFGSRVERCSLELRMFETLLLANPYIPTLRHQCSRASSVSPQTSTASPLFEVIEVIRCVVFSGASFRTQRDVFTIRSGGQCQIL